jgi:hypothetical protein
MNELTPQEQRILALVQQGFTNSKNSRDTRQEP